MNIKCPACNAQISLDAAINVDAARLAISRALEMQAPMASLIASYLGLSRHKSRSLSFSRVATLLEELNAQISAQEVRRNGRTLPANHAIWRQSFEDILELRDRGKLTLPMKTNGYLLDIVLSHADKQEAQQERAAEERLKAGKHRKPPPQNDGDRRTEEVYELRTDMSMGLITPEEGTALLKQLTSGEITPDQAKQKRIDARENNRG